MLYCSERKHFVHSDIRLKLYTFFGHRQCICLLHLQLRYRWILKDNSEISSDNNSLRSNISSLSLSPDSLLFSKSFGSKLIVLLYISALSLISKKGNSSILSSSSKTSFCVEAVSVSYKIPIHHPLIHVLFCSDQF